ncbi:MAG: hypothetical protein EXS05_02905 [Planctomycetaceae bacterium]|nr:hypothetical protein [Planctomycetaceae bacterium]
MQVLTGPDPVGVTQAIVVLRISVSPAIEFCLAQSLDDGLRVLTHQRRIGKRMETQSLLGDAKAEIKQAQSNDYSDCLEKA